MATTRRPPLAKDEEWTPEEELIEFLLRSYDTDARGVADVEDTVTVTVQLLLLRIQGLVGALNDSLMAIKGILYIRE